MPKMTVLLKMQVEKERFDFIPLAVDSALFNLERGSYLPPAWWVGTYGDHVLKLVFEMLELHRINDKGEDFETIARSYVDRAKWGDQPYAKEHVFRIACRISEEIKKRPPVIPRGIKSKQELAKPGKKWWQFW
jgi:hypothetical protein